MHPESARLIAFTSRADIPAIVFPGLHYSEKTHEVEEAH